jgi:hypothetical protein
MNPDAGNAGLRRGLLATAAFVVAGWVDTLRIYVSTPHVKSNETFLFTSRPYPTFGEYNVPSAVMSPSGDQAKPAMSQ